MATLSSRRNGSAPLCSYRLPGSSAFWGSVAWSATAGTRSTWWICSPCSMAFGVGYQAVLYRRQNLGLAGSGSAREVGPIAAAALARSPGLPAARATASVSEAAERYPPRYILLLPGWPLLPEQAAIKWLSRSRRRDGARSAHRSAGRTLLSVDPGAHRFVLLPYRLYLLHGMHPAAATGYSQA
jgi:hypothetical protein